MATSTTGAGCWRTARSRRCSAPRTWCRPYSGAVCQYVLERDSGPDVGAGAPPATTIDVTFSWFETGNLDRERTLAEQRGAQITDKVVERHHAFLARRDTTARAVRRPRRPAPACSAGGCRSAASPTSTPARTPRSCSRARCRRSCDHVPHHVVPEALRALLAGVAVLAAGCGAPDQPAATETPAVPAAGGFRERRVQQRHRRGYHQGGGFVDVHQGRRQRRRLFLAGEHDARLVRGGHGDLDVVVPRQ